MPRSETGVFGSVRNLVGSEIHAMMLPVTFVHGSEPCVASASKVLLLTSRETSDVWAIGLGASRLGTRLNLRFRTSGVALNFALSTID